MAPLHFLYVVPAVHAKRPIFQPLPCMSEISVPCDARPIQFKALQVELGSGPLFEPLQKIRDPVLFENGIGHLALVWDD